MAVRKKKKSARARRADPPAAAPLVMSPKALVLRTPLGNFDFGDWQGSDAAWTRQLQKAAMEWTYVVRNRQRWRALHQSAASMQNRAREQLSGLGLSDQGLEAIARCGIAEVSISYQTEQAGWEARIFPWEFVIAGATREQRQGRPLTVTRVLDRAARISRNRRPGVHKVLYVQSSPGALRDLYEFDSEREIVEANLGMRGARVVPLITPTLDELRRTVAKELPDVVHLAGFDSHEGMRLLKMPTEGPEVLDGYLLEGGTGGSPVAVDAQSLGTALTGGGKHQPLLVVCNFHNSAARTAPMALAAGVHHAIGIQDTIDDSLVELFLAAFYRAWRRGGWDVHLGFRTAWQQMRAHSAALSGTGLVLWSNRPLVSATTSRGHVQAERRPVWLPDKRLDLVEDILKLDIKPRKELNYAQLHNKQPLFENFTLINASASLGGRDVQATLADVEIDVTLCAGQEETRFRRQLRLDAPSLELRDEVHLPLISMLMRTVTEAMNTSLQVEVKWGRTLFRDSFFVRLLPVDQWRDNDRDGQWLPSFVLPRDRVVPGLIDKAQHYVRVVRDDPAAGFDGYQSFDPQAAEPAVEVDLQVQAIWSMLVHELKLGYVNPPPTYSNELDSQRLRTPSMVVQHRCGTCIDLALLLAACLEHVDIYPVVFLLKDHAFPGYWRSEDARQKFIEMKFLPSDVTGENRATTEVAGSQTVPWWFRDSAYKEIVRQVQAGALVPLESVWLTEHSGFADAIEGGRDNLKSARRFHSMLDIVRAREAQVTPLPIGDMP